MTSKCVSRHSPVHFFENCQGCSRADVSNMLAWKHSCAACNFWFLIPPDSSTPAALASLPFDPPAPDWEKHSASHLFYPFARVDLLCTCFSLTLATLFFKATYAMFVLIDWTWLNDVCLQVILKPYARHPQGLRFSSGRFRAKKAFQLLADAEWSLIGTSCQWQIISRLLTFYALTCLKSQISTAHQALPTFSASMAMAKQVIEGGQIRRKQRCDMKNHCIMPSAHRLIFDANDARMPPLSQWIPRVGLDKTHSWHSR